MTEKRSRLAVMNVLHDGRIGGPQVRVASVGTQLENQGVSTTVVCPESGADAASFFNRYGLSTRTVRFAKIPNPRKVNEIVRWALSLPRDAWRMYKISKEQNPALIHVNSIYMFHAALAARVARIPLLWHLNDTGLPPRVAKFAGRFAHLIANRMVAAAGAVGRHHGLKDGEFDIFYAPVDTGKFTPQPKPPMDTSRPRLGIVANWNWMKGYDDLIEVLAELKSVYGIRAHAICLGRVLDNQRDYHAKIMSDAQALGVADQIEVMGFVEEPASMVAGIDILLLPSRSEACPISVLEAMSCGVPVVAFDVGGVREQLLRPGLECGILVGKRDTSAMALAIKQLTEDREKYESMGTKGREAAKAVFDTSVVAQKHLQVYRALAGV